MLRSVKELVGYSSAAIDGDIGTVDQFYFDDETWTIRYLVVNTGSWLAGRRVLISPVALRQADWVEQRLHLALTKEQIERSPDIDTQKPVSRQHEIKYFNHFGWPYYWRGEDYWGVGMYPGNFGALAMMGHPNRTGMGSSRRVMEQETTVPEEQGDPHLRSTKEVAGYYIEARDGEIGHVEDFIVDDETWAIRYVVVDTANWWPGKEVLVSPQWIKRVSWTESKVYIDLPKEAIKNSPEFDPTAPINRDYEGKLYDYYGRAPYWG